MSQTIDVDISGDMASAFPLVWSDFLAALFSGYSGTSRPSFAVVPTIWYNTSDKTFYSYDGASDISLFTLDTVNHRMLPPIGGGATTLASATTVDLGSVAQTAITISGTTTITGFGSSMLTGQIKVLTFSGVMTLTHNGTSLIIPGEANKTTVAGDTASVMCIGSGLYRVVSYSDISGGDGGGSWNLLQTQTVSSAVTSVDFTSGIDSTYKNYVLVITEMVSSAAVQSMLRLGDSSGFDLGGSDYAWLLLQPTTGGVYSTLQDEYDSRIGLDAGNQNGLNAVYHFTRPTGGTAYPAVFGTGNDSITGRMHILSSVRQSAITLDRIQVLKDGAQTINSGTFKLYGIS